MCVAITTVERENRPYAVLVSGVTSVFGSSLPANGVTVTLTSKRNGVVDFLYELFAGFSQESIIHIALTSSGGAVGLVTDAANATVWRAANGLSFAQPVEGPSRRPVRDVDDATGHGLWVINAPNDAGTSLVSHFDDGPVERVGIAGNVFGVLPIDDGSAIIRTEGKPDSRIVQGMQVALPPALQGRITGYVRDSSDVLLTEGQSHNRASPRTASIFTNRPFMCPCERVSTLRPLRSGKR